MEINNENIQNLVMSISGEDLPECLNRIVSFNTLGTDGIYSNEYPGPPLQLNYVGEKSLLSSNNIKVAVIGSRNGEGLQLGNAVANRAGRMFAENDIITISGNAAEIDNNAQLGALNVGGKVISVLARGFDSITGVKESAYKVVNNNGLLVTEMPIGTTYKKGWEYLCRNRITVGLSDVVFLPYGNLESGTHQAVKQAYKYKVPIIAYMPPVGTPSGSLNNELDMVAKNNKDHEGLIHIVSNSEELIEKIFLIKHH